jgi:hypothetical protein
MENIDKYLDTAALSDIFGTESYAEASRNNAVTKRTSLDMNSLKKQYDAASMDKLKVLVLQFLPEYPTYSTMSTEEKNNAYRTDMSIKMEAAASEIVSNKAYYRYLPTDLTRVLDKLKAPMAALESQMAGLNKGSDDYFACKWKRDRYKNAMESIVFNTLTGAHKQMQLESMGMEGVGMYSQAVFYPVFETAIQYANVAGTIYNKVCKVKQLLNEVTSIPIHTKKIYAVFTDPTTKKETKIAREKLYSKFDVSEFAPTAYTSTMFDREVTITKADFNKVIRLREDPLTGTTDPILGPLEEVRSDFRVLNMEVTLASGGTKTINELYDFRAGLALADAMNEIDRKGKVFTLALDKTNTAALNYLAFYFDNIERTLSIVSTPSNGARDIESLTIRFHLHDPNMVNRPNMQMMAYEEQHFINAGTPVRYDIPINNNEFAIINSRQTGDYLNQIVNLTAEFGAHQKENLFFNEYMAMYDDLKSRQDDAELSELDLFNERSANMNILNTNRKVEQINLVLGPQFDNLIQGLSITANSAVKPQVNFFCHSATLPVINQALKLITGEVNQDTNGKFLGVNQEYTTHILTVGSDATAPVHSIVVATNKNDLKHKSTDAAGNAIPVDQIEYSLYGIPYFQEANLETVLFTETATRITNTADVRSNANPLIPAMIMESNIGFAKLRPAAAKITISGYHTAPSVR